MNDKQATINSAECAGAYLTFQPLGETEAAEWQVQVQPSQQSKASLSKQVFVVCVCLFLNI